MHRFRKISEGLNVSVEIVKNKFSETLQKYRNSPEDLSSKLSEHIKQHESLLYFDYCLENFSEICRFCFRTRYDVEMKEILIFDELQDQTGQTEASKITYTLGADVS